ncbi:MAG: 2OG-Fe(II) oxygenase [Vicinamibacterales bacterium]
MAHHTFLRQLGIFTAPGFLSPDECAEWRARAATSRSHAAHVYRNNEVLLDEEQRRTLEVTVEDAIHDATRDRILGLRQELARHFAADLEGLDHLRCMKYREGDFFKLHADVPRPEDIDEASRFAGVLRRRVSIVTFLNDPAHASEPYAGGELTLFGLMQGAAADYGFPVDAETGLMVAFPAGMLHEVSPVLSGSRFTLVTWFLAKDPRESSV